MQNVENGSRDVKGKMEVPVAIAINHVTDKLVFLFHIERTMEMGSKSTSGGPDIKPKGCVGARSDNLSQPKIKERLGFLARDPSARAGTFGGPRVAIWVVGEVFCLQDLSPRGRIFREESPIEFCKKGKVSRS